MLPNDKSPGRRVSVRDPFALKYMFARQPTTNYNGVRDAGDCEATTNSVCHMHDLQSIEACFTQARKHLAPEGRFVLHMYNPGFQILTRDPSQRYPVAEYEDPHGRGHVVVTENNIYDRASQINQIKWYYNYQQTGEEFEVDLPMRMFFPQELDALLHYNGFEIEHKYGDYDMREFASDSTFQIPVCRR